MQGLGTARQSRAAERAELDRAGQGKGSAGAGQGEQRLAGRAD